MSTDSPTLDALTARVRAFSEARDWVQFHSPRNLAMALSVEASELLELYLWCDDDGPQPRVAEREPKVADEAADVLMCLLNLCDQAGIDLGRAFHDKMDRAEKKYPVERVHGKALKYSEYDEFEGEQ
ncbi:MAG: dCTP diphosphatase [Myxococcota bacterium]|jgi:dCTP diphosphatase